LDSLNLFAIHCGAEYTYTTVQCDSTPFMIVDGAIILIT